MENTETNIINALIGAAAEEDAKQKIADAELLAANLDALTGKIAKELGEIWMALAPYVAKKEYDQSSKELYLSYMVRADALELEPFYIQVATNRDVRLSKWETTHSWGDKTPVSNISQFLAERRRSYPEWKKSYLEIQTRPLVNAFLSLNMSPGKAHEYLDQLIKIDPENTKRWHSIHADWDMRLARATENKQREELEKQERVQASEEYAAAYRRYLEDYARVITGNQEKLSDLQAKNAQPYDVFTLTYALFEHDEWGPHITTCDVDVLDDHPDEYNRWRTLNDGRIEEVKFLTAIKITGPTLIDPVAILNLPDCIGRKWIQNAMSYLRYNPVAGPIGLDEIVFEHLPTRPSPPECLSSYDIREVERIVKSEVGDKYPDFEDFPE